MARTLLGRKIRERRKALGLTQAALAQRLGISASYLNMIEADRRNIAGLLLVRITQALEVPLAQFDGATERRLVDDLGEIASDAALEAIRLAPGSAADLVARHPEWAQALVAVHRASREHQQTVQALSDRLGQDPFLGDAVHNLLTNLTAIRSASEILESAAELDASQRQRFVSIIAGDSRRMSDVARSLAAFFNKAHTATRSITPAEEVDDYLAEHDNHFPRLEAAADALRPQVRARGAERFAAMRAAAAEGCSAAVAAQLDAAPWLRSPAARRRTEQVLLSYLAGCLVMPYERFQPAAAALRYDIDALAQRFDASFEQVCHRLVTLRRPGAEGVRFGFMRADAAGFVSKRFALPPLVVPRHGHACPLWAVYHAPQAPGATVRQLVEFPAGGRYFMVARAVEQDADAFRQPRRFLSIMLFCSALQADRLVYADGLDLSRSGPATPVGTTCRTCVRSDCRWRQEDPIIDAGMY